MKRFIVAAFILSGAAMEDWSYLEEPHHLVPPLSERVIFRLIAATEDPIMQGRLAQLRALSLQVRGLADQNVHVLDPTVVREADNINDIGAWLNLEDRPNLTLREVGQQMTEFMGQNPLYFENWTFQDGRNAKGEKVIVPVPPEKLREWLQIHFSRMDAESAICPNIRETWSRAWTLAYYMVTSENDWDGIRMVYDAVIESYATGGQCIQGRVNRGLVAYLKLLTIIGVTAQ